MSHGRRTQYQHHPNRATQALTKFHVVDAVELAVVLAQTRLHRGDMGCNNGNTPGDTTSWKTEFHTHGGGNITYNRSLTVWQSNSSSEMEVHPPVTPLRRPHPSNEYGGGDAGQPPCTHPGLSVGGGSLRDDVSTSGASSGSSHAALHEAVVLTGGSGARSMHTSREAAGSETEDEGLEDALYGAQEVGVEAPVPTSPHAHGVRRGPVLARQYSQLDRGSTLARQHPQLNRGSTLARHRTQPERGGPAARARRAFMSVRDGTVDSVDTGAEEGKRSGTPAPSSETGSATVRVESDTGAGSYRLRVSPMSMSTTSTEDHGGHNDHSGHDAKRRRVQRRDSTDRVAILRGQDTCARRSWAPRLRVLRRVKYGPAQAVMNNDGVTALPALIEDGCLVTAFHIPPKMLQPRGSHRRGGAALFSPQARLVPMRLHRHMSSTVPMVNASALSHIKDPIRTYVSARVAQYLERVGAGGRVVMCGWGAGGVLAALMALHIADMHLAAAVGLVLVGSPHAGDATFALALRQLKVQVVSFEYAPITAWPAPQVPAKTATPAPAPPRAMSTQYSVDGRDWRLGSVGGSAASFADAGVGAAAASPLARAGSESGGVSAALSAVGPPRRAQRVKRVVIAPLPPPVPRLSLFARTLRRLIYCCCGCVLVPPPPLPPLQGVEAGHKERGGGGGPGGGGDASVRHSTSSVGAPLTHRGANWRTLLTAAERRAVRCAQLYLYVRRTQEARRAQVSRGYVSTITGCVFRSKLRTLPLPPMLTSLTLPWSDVRAIIRVNTVASYFATSALADLML